MLHIRLSEEKLRMLVEMVCLATEVASLNHQPGSDEDYNMFEELERELILKAKDAGLEEMVEPDKDGLGTMRLSKAYQESSYMQLCLDEMRNEVFWEELVLRMAERDLRQQISREDFGKLNEEHLRNLTEPIEERYWNEFISRGVENLHLVMKPEEG